MSGELCTAGGDGVIAGGRRRRGYVWAPARYEEAGIRCKTFSAIQEWQAVSCGGQAGWRAFGDWAGEIDGGGSHRREIQPGEAESAVQQCGGTRRSAEHLIPRMPTPVTNVLCMDYHNAKASALTH